ncbi:dethiobiotin synthase [Methylocystis rosea]|uniref:ATP-dependent dethiobiotin synthetase BioD n=1 Tax=Methylocystis rosea TaxID=173366 RepID=A0A3G8MDU2_9HYPH|nr:dethiobiotin synthase [Methylocystis rosea]AZG78928.1 ATP-dependent dethiobiotin synthetase BioD [Methylocystis rosea]
MKRFVIAGTDTGVGKTIFSAALAQALDAYYWKPVQSGLDGETDSQTVARLSGLSPARVLPEKWRLNTPVSPHYSAKIDGVEIDPERLALPECDRPLVIETAGGVMTPLTLRVPTIDMLARWRIPVILVARTSLGTINHSLLSIEALRRRNIPLLGVAFVGEEHENTQATIGTMGGAHILGRLPFVALLTRETLRAAFNASFRAAEFAQCAEQ